MSYTNILNGRFISALAPDANIADNLGNYYYEFKEELSKLCRSNIDFSNLYLVLMELHGVLKYVSEFSTNSKIKFLRNNSK